MIRKLLAAVLRVGSYMTIILLSTASAGAEERTTQGPSPNVNSLNLRLRKINGTKPFGAVFDVGRPSAFDAHWATCPTVVHRDGEYRMWYSSVYDSKTGRGGIGAAVSTDGALWNRLNDGKPVMDHGPSGELDEALVLAPEVLHDGERFLMWYTGMPETRHSSGIVYYRIFLAASDDGITWSRLNRGQPVLGLGPVGAPDAVQSATPTVIKDGGRYRMWYAAWSPEHNHTVCAADSSDGIRWQRENQGRPIVGLSPSIAFGPAVCRIGNSYLLLYMALKAERGLYAATSKDGIHWTMLNRNQPVIGRGKLGTFDDSWIGHPFLLNVDSTLKVWYTGYRAEANGIHGWKLRIGMAEGGLKK